MTHRRIVAFSGYKGSGKTEAARILRQQGWIQHSFASPLKAMLRAVGLSIDQLYGDLKEVPSELLCGKTPRWAMQSLGTEWGRNLIGDQFWLNMWLNSLPDGDIVVDDCRFVNEANMIRFLGGYIFRVHRPGCAPLKLKRTWLDALLRRAPAVHPSERFEFPVDYAIDNSRTLEELEDYVNLAVSYIYGGRSDARRTA